MVKIDLLLLLFFEADGVDLLNHRNGGRRFPEMRRNVWHVAIHRH